VGRRSDPHPNQNSSGGLSPSVLFLVPLYVRSDNAQVSVPGQADLQASAPTCRNVLQALNAREPQRDLGMHLLSQGNLVQVRVRWNWSANPSAETAVTMPPVAVEMGKDVPLVQQDLEPHVQVACQGCVSR
jgi:hypothetical protein